VQLVFSSLGTPKNARLFGSVAIQDAAIKGVARLAHDLGVDGVNIDVEQLDYTLIPAYGAFVGRLRTAVRVVIPGAKVSVATTAGLTGAAMAKAALDAGADRIFLMGYDYHYAGSEPGASAPMDRRDGGTADLVSSLDLYDSVGVPVEKTILGLPLYGMRWRVTGPWLGAPSEGNGAIWVPADNRAFLTSPPTPPEQDPIEIVEFYAIPPPGAASPSTASNGDDPLAPSGWQAIYVDSPATLEPKLGLADDRGLAGAGFWAIGYERGLPDYTSLIARFAAGKVQ
jgi:spore germination protein YaaH